MHLPDANALIALSWPKHDASRQRQRWFSRRWQRGWGSCVMTVRRPLCASLASPHLVGRSKSITEVMGVLRRHPGRIRGTAWCRWTLPSMTRCVCAEAVSSAASPSDRCLPADRGHARRHEAAHLRQRRWPRRWPATREREARSWCCGFSSGIAQPSAQQRLHQRIHADRLGDVVVHAGGEALLAVALHGVGGHRDDARALAGLASAR